MYCHLLHIIFSFGSYDIAFRNVDGNGDTLAFIIMYGNFPTVKFAYLFHIKKSDTKAFYLSFIFTWHPVKTVEDIIYVFRVNTRAIVCKTQRKAFALFSNIDSDKRLASAVLH